MPDLRWCAAFGAVKPQTTRRSGRARPRGIKPLRQLLLRGGWLPQARHPAIALRFLGRKVYLATVVTLISAMLVGTTPFRTARLSAVPGIDRRTLARWRAWWRSTFTDGPFAAVAMAAVVPPIEVAALPVCLLERFAGELEQRLLSLPWFLAPLTGPAHRVRGARLRHDGDARFLTDVMTPQRMRVAPLGGGA